MPRYFAGQTISKMDVSVRLYKKQIFWIVCTVFFVVHLSILLYNWKNYPKRYGYDAIHHIRYAQYLGKYGKRPPWRVSLQFYNPPTYYALVASIANIFHEDVKDAGRQIAYFVSIVTFLLLVWIAWLVWNDEVLTIFWLFGFYVFCPTVYKIFCMLRTEVLLMPMFALTVLMVIFSLRKKQRLPFWSKLVLWGLINGFSVTVRHFGFFIVAFSIVFEFILHLEERYSFRRWWCFAVVQLCIGGLSYFFVQHAIGGSGTAFNLRPRAFHFAIIACLRLKTIFSRPIRPGLNYCFLPSLYADFWGDYWRYWVEHLGIFRIPSSEKSVLLLRRMMWAAILPTFLLAGACVKSVWNWLCEIWVKEEEKGERVVSWDTYVSIFLLLSLLFYSVLAIIFATPNKGDTVKGIYIVYLVPVMAVLAGHFASWCGSKRGWLKGLLYIGGICFFYFSLPVCLCLQGVVKV